MVTLLTVVAVVAMVFLVVRTVRSSTDSPMRAVDRYLAAVQTGDRSALEQAVGGSGAQRDALLAKHSGRPVGMSTMTLRRVPSSSWLGFAVQYDDAGPSMAAEDLLVGPRPGLTPDDAAQWVVLTPTP